MNDKPQQPPAINRELKLGGKQIAGMLFILIFPVLALSGVLESGLKSIHLEENGIEADLEYPDLLRYKKPSVLTLRITKTTETLSDIQVKIDRSYLRNFSNVSFFPDPEYITDREYVFDFRNLEPGESRIIHTELKSEKVGKFSGRVSIIVLAQQPEMMFETLVLP